MKPSDPNGADGIQSDDVYDILRGVAALTGSGIVGRLAETLVRHPEAPLANAFNHKQIACKTWLAAELANVVTQPLQHVLIVGGWLGVLSAIVLDRLPHRIDHVTTLDLDDSCRSVAETLNAEALAAGRFRAVTADMMHADLAELARPWPAIDLVVNTSVEHLADVGGWLDRLPRGTMVVLQSNDYVREPEHVSSVPDLAAFKAQTQLAVIRYEGQLRQKNYTRFMLIGVV